MSLFIEQTSTNPLLAEWDQPRLCWPGIAERNQFQCRTGTNYNVGISRICRSPDQNANMDWVETQEHIGRPWLAKYEDEG